MKKEEDKNAHEQQHEQEQQQKHEQQEEKQEPQPEKKKKRKDCSNCKEYITGWQRERAEFENYKKRQQEEQKSRAQFTKQEILLDLLPVIDNFQEAYKSMPEDITEHAWPKGIGFIKQQLEQLIEEQGLTAIETEGQEFNEDLHEAVKNEAIKEDKEGQQEENPKTLIIKEVRRGYIMNEKVIRPSRVIVK